MLRKTESQPGRAGQPRGLRLEEQLWAVLGGGSWHPPSYPHPDFWGWIFTQRRRAVLKSKSGVLGR